MRSLTTVSVFAAVGRRLAAPTVPSHPGYGDAPVAGQAGAPPRDADGRIIAAPSPIVHSLGAVTPTADSQVLVDVGRGLAGMSKPKDRRGRAADPSPRVLQRAGPAAAARFPWRRRRRRSGAIVIVVDASVLPAALGDDGTDGAGAGAASAGETLTAPVLLDLDVVSVWVGRLRPGV